MPIDICAAVSVQPTTAESWRVIADYPNYEVSDLGNVRNVKTHRVLKPFDNGHGYMMVRLYKDARSKTFQVHRIVMTAFNGTIPNGCEVDHIDHDRTNNRLTNLRYVSRSENQRNKSSNKGVSYEFVDTLPVDNIPITEYCNHKFERIYYSPSTKNFYFDTHELLRVMHVSVYKNIRRIKATDVEGTLRYINIDKWKSANHL